MAFSVFVLAAAVAAQTHWVPLDGHQAKQPQAKEIQARAQAQAAGYAEAQAALSGQGPIPSNSSPIPVTPPAGSIASIHKGLLLWRNVEDGMSVRQLHALYPQGENVAWHDDRTVLTHIPIIEGCEAKVNVMHPQGVVKEIVMRGDGAIAGRCSLKIITALSGKYGEPMDKDKVHGSLFGREGKNYIWAHDGVTLQFKRYTSGALGGGGLFSASWELRYSTADTKIDL